MYVFAWSNFSYACKQVIIILSLIFVIYLRELETDTCAE